MGCERVCALATTIPPRKSEFHEAAQHPPEHLHTYHGERYYGVRDVPYYSVNGNG